MIRRRGVLLGGAALGVAAPAIVTAQSADTAASRGIVSHGLAMHGDLKYPADAGPPDYVNPDAPKGATVRQLEIGTGEP